MRGGRVRGGNQGLLLGLARFGVLVVLVPLVLAGCSKTKTPKVDTTTTPPQTIETSPPTIPTVTVTTVSPTPAASPSHSPSPSPSPKASPGVTTGTVVPPVTSTVQISATSGSTMNAKVGQILSLTLAQDSGETWNFTTLPNSGVLSIIDQINFVPSPAPSGVSQEFRVMFKGVSAGTTGFALTEAAGSAPPTTAYSVTVTVASS